MQPGRNHRDGNSFPPLSPAEDFLGLGAELRAEAQQLALRQIERQHQQELQREQQRQIAAQRNVQKHLAQQMHVSPFAQPPADPNRFRTALPPPARPAPPPPPPRNTVLMPQQELLRADDALAASWPEVRPNTWRVGSDPVPPAPLAQAPATRVHPANFHGAHSFVVQAAPPPAHATPERPSWLLELDDASIPPAHPSFVASSAPANASFRDGESEVVERVAPWFVRSLCVFAGLFLLAVITRTVLLRVAHPPAEPAPPVQPVARATVGPRHELVAPSDVGPSNRPGPRPERAGKSGDGPMLAGFESPATHVYDLPARSSDAPPAASAAQDPAAADRWVEEQSRSSAPLADVGVVRAAGPNAPGAASPAAPGTGIWEGATIPVEAISGGLRLATPGVGRVRVRLDDGTVTEGRLAAIGQGRVWVDAEGSTIEVTRERMRGLEQIAERREDAGPEAPRRQRVRTAGGVFYGRVLARDGRTVTLITDAGARISVEADELTDAEPN